MADDDQSDLFQKPQELGDDIMPNFTAKALRDLAAAGERENENLAPIPSPSWLIKGPGKER